MWFFMKCTFFWPPIPIVLCLPIPALFNRLCICPVTIRNHQLYWLQIFVPFLLLSTFLHCCRYFIYLCIYLFNFKLGLRLCQYTVFVCVRAFVWRCVSLLSFPPNYSYQFTLTQLSLTGWIMRVHPRSSHIRFTQILRVLNLYMVAQPTVTSREALGVYKSKSSPFQKTPASISATVSAFISFIGHGVLHLLQQPATSPCLMSGNLFLKDSFPHLQIFSWFAIKTFTRSLT